VVNALTVSVAFTEVAVALVIAFVGAIAVTGVLDAVTNLSPLVYATVVVGALAAVSVQGAAVIAGDELAQVKYVIQ
jgi:hypothetical protein